MAKLAPQSRKEIIPIGIGLLDQPDLPGALPFLELLFAADGVFGAAMFFIPDETMDAVSPGEAFCHALAMLPDALGEAAGDADIESTADTGLARM